MELLRPSDVAELATPVGGGVFVHGGTEVVPLLREGLLEAEQLVDVRGVVPHGIRDDVIGAGTTLAELEAEPAIPEALREACRLASSPQLRNMGSLAGNLLQATRCWYWRLGYPCRLHSVGDGWGDRCQRRNQPRPRTQLHRVRPAATLRSDGSWSRSHGAPGSPPELGEHHRDPAAD